MGGGLKRSLGGMCRYSALKGLDQLSGKNSRVWDHPEAGSCLTQWQKKALEESLHFTLSFAD